MAQFSKFWDTVLAIVVASVGGLFDQINSRTIGDYYNCGPNHSKTGPYKIRKYLPRFQMVLDKMAAICLDFKCLGYWNSDPI